MLPIYQDKFGTTIENPGNCLSACIASIFERNLNEVPNFAAARDRWMDSYHAYMDRLGYRILILQIPHDQSRNMPMTHYVVTGQSPRADCLHACVGYGGRIIHDPHPDGHGLIYPKDGMYSVDLFLPIGYTPKGEIQ